MIEKHKHNFIERSCKDYGRLDAASIAAILDVAKMLKLFSQISEYEVFIDIKVADEDFMFVIAEQLSERSYYEYSYLGDFIYRDNEPAVFKAYETAQVQESLGTSIDKKNGGRIITTQRAIPIMHEGKAVGILILEKSIDVTGGSTYSTLQQTSQISTIMLTLMQAKIENADIQIHEGVMFFDHDGMLLYANKYSEDLYRSFGYVSLQGRHFDALNLTSQEFISLINEFVLKREQPKEEQPRDIQESLDSLRAANCVTLENGMDICFFQEQTVIIGSRYFRIRFAVLTKLESFLIMFIDDVTQAKRFESGENGYLVTNREMQHRVKNNLMTVVSLLRLQARQCDNQQAKEIIDIAVNRILSISTTFEILVQGDSVSVPVLDVLRNIRDNHLDLLANTGLEVDIQVSGVDFLLDSESSTRLGLVINELLQNAIKHAFPQRTSGSIKVTTASHGDVKIVQVRDNGVGFDTSVKKEGTFGLLIIKGLVQDSLNGKITINSGDKGTTVSLAFKQI